MSRNNFRVAAFTGGVTVPSARYRVRQYIPALGAEGIEMVEHMAAFGCYPPRAKWLRPLWAPVTLASRIPSIIESFRSQVTLLQREMLSTFFTIENWTKGPRLLDVDDAIWLRREGKCARRLAESCDAVICGNQFLADRFSSWNPNIYILPTPVDTRVYSPRDTESHTDSPVIGWCGTSSGFRHIYAIEGALSSVLSSHPNASFVVVSDREPILQKVPSDRVRFIRWTPQSEIAALGQMTVGIMPLENDEWTRGKCSFKMLTYMACGLPVVVSPVGMNMDVLGHGQCGLAAKNSSDWIESLSTLLTNPVQAREMGREGRRIVDEQFSLRTLTPQFATILRSLV